jgi:hypothetical protein
MAHHQFCHSGPKGIAKFAAVAHSVEGPKRLNIFATAIDQESGCPLLIFGEITLDKKSHATVLLK